MHTTITAPPKNIPEYIYIYIYSYNQTPYNNREWALSLSLEDIKAFYDVWLDPGERVCVITPRGHELLCSYIQWALTLSASKRNKILYIYQYIMSICTCVCMSKTLKQRQCLHFLIFHRGYIAYPLFMHLRVYIRNFRQNSALNYIFHLVRKDITPAAVVCSVNEHVFLVYDGIVKLMIPSLEKNFR